MSDTKIPQLKNILTMLQSPGKRQSLGKKLILFDNADRHRALTQNLPTARRIYGAEQQALAIALQTFQELHVTNLAVIAPPIDWCDARYALLTKMAPTYGIAIQRVTDSITLWDTHYSTESFLADDIFIDECTSAHGQKYSVFKSVRRSHAQLFNILDTGCTAVLGLNDQIARRCQLALRYGREATDKPCPLLGIDNHVQTSLFGLSSIDMGFDELGYRAAHDLIGDVTVTAANGSRPHLVDRGSLT